MRGILKTDNFKERSFIVEIHVLAYLLISGFVCSSSVLEPPVITTKSDKLEVKAGDSVQLTCEVKGKPVPEIIWYHNAVPATNLITGPENGGKGFFMWSFS